MKLYDTGVYLHNGKEIIPAAEAQLPVSREDAARNTIAYSILKAHKYLPVIWTSFRLSLISLHRMISHL